MFNCGQHLKGASVNLYWHFTLHELLFCSLRSAFLELLIQIGEREPFLVLLTLWLAKSQGIPWGVKHYMYHFSNTPPCNFLKPPSQSIFKAELNPRKRQQGSHAVSMAKGSRLHQCSATLLIHSIDGVESWVTSDPGNGPGVVSSTGDVQGCEPMVVLVAMKIGHMTEIHVTLYKAVSSHSWIEQPTLWLYLQIGIELWMEEQNPSHSIVPPSNLGIRIFSQYLKPGVYNIGYKVVDETRGHRKHERRASTWSSFVHLCKSFEMWEINQGRLFVWSERSSFNCFVPLEANNSVSSYGTCPQHGSREVHNSAQLKQLVRV